MASLLAAARNRQTARLNGTALRSASAALAFAKSQQYQDADATLRERIWLISRLGAKKTRSTGDAGNGNCRRVPCRGRRGHALPTLRRRVAAIDRACRVTGHPLDTKHPAIRETLRDIGRSHGGRSRRTVALTTNEIKKLSEACGGTLAGKRDRALFLLGLAGALAVRNSLG